MIVIGICGASGSGKSTLASEIQSFLSCNTMIIGQDWYYKDHPHLPFQERERLNYDKPDIFDYDTLYDDVCKLNCGQSITKKGYDYAEHRRADSEELITPPDVLILEGIHIFYDERLRDMLDLKVFMHVDVDVCLLRRIKRDIKERGRHIDGISLQYLSTVKPMYDLHISKYISVCDFAVMSGGRNRRSIEAIGTFVNYRLEHEGKK